MKVKLEDDVVGEIAPVLRPCPFCGGEDIRVCLALPRFHDETTKYYVACIYCKCRTGSFETKSEAEKAWNRRSADA